MKKQLAIILLSAFFLSCIGNGVFAQWIAPGELSKAHKELSGVTSCLKCHTLTEGLDNTACKSCHEEWKKKIQANQGLHARIKVECITCHTDHKGKDFDITSLDEESFDHALTGYWLQDSHKIACNKCHKKEDTYLDLTPECLGCHSDIHKKTVSEDCSQCHNYQDWKDFVFDHSKNAEFKLTGKHADAKCELCHPRNQVTGKAGDTDKVYQVLKFKPIKSEKCIDCHYDVHDGQFKGQVCDACHSLEKGWKDYTFRHESAQYKGYKLEGKHKEVDCGKCHERSEMVYAEFEREKKTLTGKFKPLKAEVCSNCHYDVHNGQFKKQKCDACHTVKKAWKEYIFDHESEKFSYKLEGKHKEVECEKCHERSEVRYTEFKSEKKALISTFKKIKSDECKNCHYDVHNGQFKKQKCDACHTVKKAWKEYTFDHESEKVSYKLEGKHKEVECEKCHERSEVRYTEFKREKKALISAFKQIESEECSNCHYDIHNGQFKDQTCDACHSVKKEWKDNTFSHESEKYRGYRLEGKHKEVECEKCHKRSEISFTEFNKKKKVSAGTFKPLNSENCNDCHKDEHTGAFKQIETVQSVTCTDCHSLEREWKERIYKHKDDSKYHKYNRDGNVKESDCAACHICSTPVFCISCCFEDMGIYPGR
jgi:hypothetical protein